MQCFKCLKRDHWWLESGISPAIESQIAEGLGGWWGNEGSSFRSLIQVFDRKEKGTKMLIIKWQRMKFLIYENLSMLESKKLQRKGWRISMIGKKLSHTPPPPPTFYGKSENNPVHPSDPLGKCQLTLWAIEICPSFLAARQSSSFPCLKGSLTDIDQI